MNRRQREKLIELLSDPEYRRAFAESTLNSLIAAQIRANRLDREWNQAELAQKAGMHQSQISAMEDVNYGSWTIKSLRRLSEAFDLALVVRFESFSNLLREYVEGFGNALLVRQPFGGDHGLLPTSTSTATRDTQLGAPFSSMADITGEPAASTTKVLVNV